MIETVSTLFSGGGLFDKGAELADKKVLWGVELDERPIILYKLNFPKSRMIKGNVAKIDYSCLSVPDLLHASPSCVNFSQASYSQVKMQRNKENDKDIESALGVVKALNELQPPYFSLENVYDYEYSISFEKIYQCLVQLGYYIEVYKLDLYQYGIPQHRKRFFVFATNLSKRSQILTLPGKKTPKGWYEVVADLIPTLPKSSLTNTQKRCLLYRYYAYLQPNPKNPLPYLLLKRSQVRKRLTGQWGQEAAFTITASLCTDHKGNNRSKFADILSHKGAKSLSLRGLARLQTVPDDYHLIEEPAIDGRVIGNGVPPAFVRQLLSSLA